MAKTLIKNCKIADFINMSSYDSDILINDNIYERIEKNIKPNQNWNVIDAKGMLALPAFVDSHTHMVQTFLKGYMDDFAFSQWLVLLEKYDNLLTDEDRYYSVLLGCLQSLRFGTTLVNDMFDSVDSDIVVQAFNDSGIRAVLGVAVSDLKKGTNLIDKQIKASQDFVEKYHLPESNFLQSSVAPIGLFGCSDILFKELKYYSKSKNIIFHTHLAEGKEETDLVKRRFGGIGEAEVLNRLDILDEKTITAHNIWLQEKDFLVIKNNKSNIVHCPSTNLKICGGISPVYKMDEMGINICIGCDGEASSSNRDMIREGRLASYLQKISNMNPSALPPKNVYKMMTLNGANSLGFGDKLGSIEIGKLADLLLFNINNITLVNNTRPLNNLFYSGSGYDIDTVILDGKVIIRNSNFVSIDSDKIIEKCQTLMNKLTKKIEKL